MPARRSRLFLGNNLHPKRQAGGLGKAREVNHHIAKDVGVTIGNEEDFTASLGFQVEEADENLSLIETNNFKKWLILTMQRPDQSRIGW